MLKDVSVESVLEIVGEIKKRPEKMQNPAMYFYKLVTPAGISGGKFIIL